MPFGLKNAPYYFSRLMAELLQGCEKFALPYLDDVAIFSENWDDHISHTDKVLERIRDARLTIKQVKCKFAQDSVKYLGHVVGLGKRSPAQLKVQTILDFPVPRTKTQDDISVIPCSCRPQAATTNLSNSCTCGLERFPSARNDTFVDSKICSYTGQYAPHTAF
ncbi:hypothetical protein TNCV_1883621 [Trichonephila clavipes]|nr:hypothetical protein TNCV_1883621 [Trichonephila clavipes]